MEIQNTILYFSYGSNMLAERMRWRVGKANKVGTYKLKGYTLVFNCGYRDSAYANIIKSENKNDFVEGVLWEISSRQLYDLNRFESFPFNYEMFWFIHGGRVAYGYISIADWFKTEGRPSKEYFDIMLEGALENDLQFTYNKLLEYEKQHKIYDRKEPEDYLFEGRQEWNESRDYLL